MAVKAMAEVGIDISSQRSKRIDEAGGSFDLLVTVCGDAAESCPSVPGATVIHAGFDDPPRLALSAASEDEAMSHYRRVRDEIRSFIANLPRELEALVARDRPNGARIDMTAVEP